MSEPDLSQLLTVAEAIEVIDREPVSPRVVQAPLAEADGLVLAEDIMADRDYPPFDKAQMDGYAVRCDDLAGAPAELRVAGEIAAGEWPERTVKSGEAIAIMTGAPMPAGADGVVPIEDTRVAGDRVIVLAAPRPGRYIAPAGSDVKARAVVLEKGARLGPARLAVAASVGASRLNLFARPRAAVLATGDELVDVDQTPQRATIRNSNNIMLVALLRRMGCAVTDLGIVRDDPAAIRRSIEQGMTADVLLVTGGMSMGEYDFVPRILLELGVQLRITKVRIKPGKPFVFGVREHSFVFGLPGNPVSGFVCATRLASRLVARLSGDKVEEKWVHARLEEPLGANGPREFYQPAIVRNGSVAVLGWKGSADLYTLAKANALLVRPENEPARQPGDVVKLLEVPR